MNTSIRKRLLDVVKDPFSSLRKVSTRFLIPLFIVSCVKLLGGIILYHILKMGVSDTYWMTVELGREGQNEILRSGINGTRWLYLFLGWDSAWYLSIAEKGYTFSDQSFAFFPGLPFFSRVLNVVFHNSFLGMTMFTIFVGTLWIPVYQLVAEIYMDRSQALKSTLFYAFFPTVFLFTTVVYSEGLFLVSTLGAWYFLQNEKPFLSMVFASIATISRPPGFLILFPILIETMKKYSYRSSVKRRHILYLAIPVCSFLTWLLYCKITVNDWFAPFNRSYWNEMPSLVTLLLNFSSGGEVQLFFKSRVWLLLLPLILVIVLIRIDRSLAIYSASYYLGALAFGGFASLPRFISFLFPIWLPLTMKLSQVKKSNLVIIIMCAVFCIVGLSLWYGFLNGEFIS